MTTHTLVVGADSGDIRGTHSFALQAAADEVARRWPGGEGTLVIRPGTYTMFDSLHIRAPMHVIGGGADTVLLKCPQVRTELVQDFDLSETVAYVADAVGLRVGMGVAIKDARNKDVWHVSVRSIAAIDGQAVRLDRRPDRDYSVSAGAWIQNSFPIISCRGVSGVVIEDLVADGNRAANADIPLDGCRGGAIYFHDVRDCVVRRCVGRNFNGDGISWQTTENMLVEDCQAYGNAQLGLHPGTGSPRTTVRRCHAHHNGQIGLFLCWGVRFGRFEDNLLEDNGRAGISIGHKDTDNLLLRNTVRRNGVVGVLFRDESERNAGHRCTLRQNIIEDNGRPEAGGFGIELEGFVRDTVLEGNTIRDTRSGSSRTQIEPIHCGPDAAPPVMRAENVLG